MARSVYNWADFLGGEWSPFAQGRIDDAKYSTAMALCLNNYPIEEGPCTRRSGTQFLVPTYKSGYAKILPYIGSETCAFIMEFTNGALRILTQSSLITDNTVSTITNSGTGEEPSGVVDITPTQDWVAGDQLLIQFPPGTSIANQAGLRNMVLTIAEKISGTAYDLEGWGTTSVTVTSPQLVGAQLVRVVRFTTPYSGQSQLAALRSVQVEEQAVILSGSAAPQILAVTTQGVEGLTDPVFTFEALTFLDGPYENWNGDTGTVSAYTGTITFTTAVSTPFVSTDVGRQIRLFSQPPLWAVGTAYTTGEFVTDASGAWWQAIINSTGNVPGTLLMVGGVATVAWVPAPNAGSWVWGLITIVHSSSEVSLAIQVSGATPALAAMGLGLNMANGTTISMFQLGAICETVGYPTCGTWHEGRLWLAGTVSNRIDASVSNGMGLANGVALGTVVFSPTDQNGNVLDNSGISEIINSKTLAQIQWMIPALEGILMGTLEGEWLLQASALNDPITPTSIQIHEMTSFGSANIEATRAGIAVLFVQKYGQRLMEYIADVFSGKPTGKHLNKYAKHLSSSGIIQVAYQEELTPIVWALMGNGLLAGCTYRRFSRFGTEDPVVEGWHWHMHGGQRTFTGMAVIPGADGLLDRLFLVTNDPPTQQAFDQTQNNNYFIEVLQPLFDQQNTILQGWFVDQAPGVGPGSLSDCGGGNVFNYAPQGALVGADSVANPSMDNVPPMVNGSSTTAGGALGPVVAFDGATALYGLPNPGADQTAVSLSVWVTVEDLTRITGGALLQSPSLSELGTIPMSGILGGLGSGVEYPQSLLIAYAAADNYTGGTGFNASGFDPTTAATGPWVNLLISTKATGSGTASILAYANETLLVNESVAFSSSFGDLWPFGRNPDGAAAGSGPTVWCIGGVNTSNGTTLPPQQVVSQTFTETLGSLTELAELVASGQRNPTPSQYAVRTIQITELVSVPSGPPTVLSNIPVTGTPGMPQGFVCQGLTELWVVYGNYVDWTNAKNRAHFHSFDTGSGKYIPADLGAQGQKPTGSPPWLYLTGGPNQFSTNRANGKTLNISGALLESEVTWPPQVG